MTVYIYHELQDSHLCGQHCLNNLLQEDFFSAVNLADVAHELDYNERAILGVESSQHPPSSNVDESGNFSIQVLRLALQRYNNIDLIPWHFNSEGEDSDPLLQQGFVVNRSEHWFTIRKINNNWWNLNSTLERPELVSQFYLSALLHQLRQDGYSVFIARGNLPQSTAGASSHHGSSGDNRTWYTEDELLNTGTSNRGNEAAAGKPAGGVVPFSGTGHRLGGGDQEMMDNAGVNIADFMVDGEDMGEDLLLAQAISASLAAQPPAVSASVPSSGDPKNDAAAEMRAKRLAALEKRGL